VCPYISIVSGHRSFNVISKFHYHIPPSGFLVGCFDGSGFPLLQGTPRKRVHKNEANGAGKNEMVLQLKLTLPSLFSRIVSLALTTLSERRSLDLIVRGPCEGHGLGDFPSPAQPGEDVQVPITTF